MKILLTNDDGIESPGLEALETELGADHDVWTVAPAHEQSAVSHSITIRGAVRTRTVGPQRISCRGTPVDCILVSLNGLLPDPPDVVISGINIGPNIGSEIFFSGTAAAARQAALRGIPAAAVSIDSFDPPFHFAPAARFIARNLELLVELWSPDHFANINIPNTDGDWTGVVIGEPCHPQYENLLRRFEAPTGEEFHFYHGQMKKEPETGKSDLDALITGRISISPISVDPVLSEAADAYAATRFLLDDREDGGPSGRKHSGRKPSD